MATATKKKSPAKKKPALKKSNKVNPYLIAVGAIVVAIIGALVVRASFAGSWPYQTDGQCGGITNRLDRYTVPPTLQQGSKGLCVKVLQDGLKATGFMKSTVKTDGIFGPQTKNSVVLLQSYYGYKNASGVVNKCTWMTLQGAAYYGKTANVKLRKDKVKFFTNLEGGKCL